MKKKKLTQLKAMQMAIELWYKYIAVTSVTEVEDRYMSKELLKINEQIKKLEA